MQTAEAPSRTEMQGHGDQQPRHLNTVLPTRQVYSTEELPEGRRDPGWLDGDKASALEERKVLSTMKITHENRACR